MINDNIKKHILDKIYSKMNEKQREAIYKTNGPTLILAGAGSGKTTVIVNKISFMINFGDCYYSGNALSENDSQILSNYNEGDNILEISNLISFNKIKPWNILTITFTNKASKELKERISSMLGEDIAKDINCGTFHSICIRILRREISRIGFTSNFTIYDTDDSIRVIKDCYLELNLNEKMFPFRAMLTNIGKIKDRILSPEEYKKEVGDDYKNQVLYNVYSLYQTKLKRSNAVDFDDIIYLTVRLFLDFDDVLSYYQDRYKYVLVDEYQDTNNSQYMLISLISKKNKNICVVGDDDQSIYKFRGATIENILMFEKQFDNCFVVRLEQNYRSTQNILNAANRVIDNNTLRKGKNLWTNNDEGEKIYLYSADDEQKESEYIAGNIVEFIKSGGKYSDNIVLYRINAQSATIERCFVRLGIPYKIIGGTKFFERKEIKDIVSYLSVVNNYNDSVRLKRIINEPKRGIGDSTVKLIEKISEIEDKSMFEIIDNCDQYEELYKKKNSIIKFKNIITDISRQLEIEGLSNVIDIILDKSDYLLFLKSQGKEAIPRIENINELKTNIQKYMEENPDGTLSGFLEEISLYTDLNNLNQSEDSVILMTVHSAKGLEFNNVFIAGMEEGIFPGYRSINDPVELEEERRLAYVAFTRAKKKLYITTARYRMIFGSISRNKISRFAEEIPLNLVDYKDDKVYYNKNDKDNKKPVYKKHDLSEAQNAIAGISLERQKIAIDYIVGDNIIHSIFGLGRIISMKPMGNDTLLEINFEGIGNKKIMANFAKVKKA
ncbi:MAG: UvrD-helicase domain-containing protein [Oscillospiraceae bacterium]|nr:UvrD-helicase domain-containing protein [Oscillospiraceae bacterium]